MRFLQVSSSILAVSSLFHVAFGQIKPKAGSKKGKTVVLDTSGITKKLHDMNKIFVQLEVNGDTIHFESHKHKGKNYFYGLKENGASINLLERTRESDGSKMYVGSVVTKDKIYSINGNAKGKTVATKKLIKDFPQEGPPETAEPTADDLALNRRLKEKGLKKRVGTNDDGSVMDVMILWTKAAECRISGESSDCEVDETTYENAYAIAELCITETNTAYELSGVLTQMNLVYAYREPDYVESSGDAFGDALNELKQTEDGIMDDVHTKREQYNADIVAMLIDDSAYCGLGYLGPYKSSMFSVSYWSCATGYYTFGHETGHNLGLKHDQGTEDACDATTEYRYGYRDPQSDFRTIMAYGCESGQCDNNSGDYCGKCQRFSTPLVDYYGKALGTSNSDNARRINDVRVQVSQYYISGTTVSPTVVGSPNPTPSPTIPECQTDSDCSGTDPCTDYLCEGYNCVEKTNCDVCGLAEVEIEILTDNYPTETTWNLYKGDEIELSGGSYPDKHTTYDKSACIEEGHTYTFTINDTYGDGICCCYGSGYYSVKVDGTEELSGGDFGASETGTFYVGDSPPTSSPIDPPSCKGFFETCQADYQCCNDGKCYQLPYGLGKRCITFAATEAV